MDNGSCRVFFIVDVELGLHINTLCFKLRLGSYKQNNDIDCVVLVIINSCNV